MDVAGHSCFEMPPICIRTLEQTAKVPSQRQSFINEITTISMLEEIRRIIKSEIGLTDHVIEYNGKPVISIKKGFRQLCKDCDIKASPHVLRHTAATWLVMDGVPLAEVARLLGDSEKTVENVYGKHAPDYLRRAVNLLKFRRQPLQP